MQRRMMRHQQREACRSGRAKGQLYLRIHPDPVLRSSCTPVEHFDAALEDVASEMLALMRAGGGIGLAAPQVGLSCELFVAELEGQTLRLTNPRILSRSGSSELAEGCLSLPGRQVVVTRDQEIRVCAYDLRGCKVEIAVSGLWARVIEHEIDHLRGVLIIDHGKVVSQR
jgi:peptide deformylase